MSEENEEVKISAGEQKARDSGWVPQDEWKGDADDWVDYKQFNIKGELMGRINEQSSIINHLKSKVEDRDGALNDLKEMQSKIAKKAYNDALADLKAQKVQALEDDDHSAVVELDDQINDLKAAKPDFDAEERAPAADTPQMDPVVDAWLKNPDNSWYHTDMDMKGVADGIANQLQVTNPNMSPADMLAQVESRMRQLLPHKFQAPNSHGDVDSGGDYSTGNKRGGKAPSMADLNDEQKAACRRFKKIGLMDEKEYIQSLVDAGEL